MSKKETTDKIRTIGKAAAKGDREAMKWLAEHTPPRELLKDMSEVADD